LCEGFQSYRDFFNRPKSLEASYQLRKDNSDRFAYDRRDSVLLCALEGTARA